MGFSAGLEAGIECDQGLVPAVGGREGGGKQGTAQAAAAAGDVSLAFVFSAVVIKGRQTCEGCSFFAADLPELGHADQKRQRGALADAGRCRC